MNISRKEIPKNSILRINAFDVKAGYKTSTMLTSGMTQILAQFIQIHSFGYWRNCILKHFIPHTLSERTPFLSNVSYVLFVIAVVIRYKMRKGLICGSQIS